MKNAETSKAGAEPKRPIMVTLAMAASIVLAACGIGSTPPSGTNAPDATAGTTATPLVMRPVSFRVDFGFNGKHVPFLTGVEQGIYKKHGIDLTVREGTGSTVVAQAVANGSDDFGLVDGGVLVQTVAKGVPIKNVFGFLQSSSMVVLATKESGITKLKDIEGKRGAFSPGSSVDRMFPALAAKAGIQADTIERVQVDSATRDTLLISKRVDFAFNLLNGVPRLEIRCKCTLTVIKWSDHGIDILGHGIVARNALLTAQNADMVKAFLAATQESIEFALKNPSVAVDDFFKYAKTTQETSESILAQWKVVVDNNLIHTPATRSLPIGCTATADWQATIDLLVQYGDVAAGSVAPATAHSNEYLNCT